MEADVIINGDTLQLKGNVEVAADGRELDVSGALAGYAFHDRSNPQNRYVLYANQGKAFLWQDGFGDILTIEGTNVGAMMKMLKLELHLVEATRVECKVLEANLAMGLSVNQPSSITQFTQMSGKAKVLAEDLKPIVTASPVIAKAINDMFGTVDSEKISATLQAAGRGPKDFIADLVAKLSQLERVSGGPKNALENLGDSFTIAGYEAGKAADNALGLTAKIDALGSLVSNTATKFGTLPPGLQAVTLGLVGTAAAVGPLALGLGTLISLGPQFAKGFDSIKSGIAALLSPIGVATIAIGAAVATLAILGTSIAHYSEGLETSADKAKIFATTNDQVAASIAGEQSKLQSLLGIARDETISKRARLQAVKDINAISPQYLGNISLETINTVQATNAINQYANALRLKAKVQTLSQQSADASIALERAQAKSAKDYVDNSRFSQDQIAINIKTTASFSPQEDRARLFKELGESRKNAEVARLGDAAKIIDAEYKKAFEEASKQNIELKPPTIKPFDYHNFLDGTLTGIKKAKDELKKLGDEIASDKLKGLDVSAKNAQYDQLKAQIKDATSFTREQKIATEGVGSALTTNERILKSLTKELKEQGDNASQSLKDQAAAMQLLVDADKTRVSSLNKQRPTAEIKPIELGQNELSQPIVPVALGVTLDPISTKNTNAQVRAIVDNIVGAGKQVTGVFGKTGAKDFLNSFQLAGPSLDFFRNKIDEIKTTIAELTLRKEIVPPELLAQLKTLKGAVRDAFAGAGAADAATNAGEQGEIDAKFIARAQERIQQMKAQGKVVKQTAEEMGADMQSAEQALKGQAVGLLSAIGEGIGSGENPLKSILKTILGFLGDFMIKIGSAMVLGGTLLTAAITAFPFLAPFISIKGPAGVIAGGALVVGGGLVKGFAGSFEGGGLFRGESLIRVGESSRAIAGGGEFVAPVALGANLIGDQISKNLRLNDLQNTPPTIQAGKSTTRIDVADVVVDGAKLRYILQVAEEHHIAFHGPG